MFPADFIFLKGRSYRKGYRFTYNWIQLIKSVLCLPIGSNFPSLNQDIHMLENCLAWKTKLPDNSFDYILLTTSLTIILKLYCYSYSMRLNVSCALVQTCLFDDSALFRVAFRLVTQKWVTNKLFAFGDSKWVTKSESPYLGVRFFVISASNLSNMGNF